MKIFVTTLLALTFFFTAPVNGENKSFNRKRTFDVRHYIMRLSFDRAKKTVYGEATIRLSPLEKDFRTLSLDAANIKFSSITDETTDQKLEFRTDRKQVVITLDKPYDPEELISITLKYSAVPKKGIYFVDALREKGKIVRSAQIWTQGESEETHHWLPSFDFPDDKATTEKIITVRRGETVIGNGELVSKIDNPNGTTTFHYRMPVAHSLYLTSFVVGRYEKITDNYRGIPLGFYIYPGQKSIVPKAFGKTKEMFRIFEELTGVEYPYNKYDQTLVAGFQFGGMENITATTMADTEIMMARYSFGQPLVENLVSHELAHSWFGNLVTCRNWAELWLNESFATFMEAAYREKMYGRKDYIRKIRDDSAEYFAYASGSVNRQHGLFNQTADPNNDDTMFDPITYQKGSAVIHMLREEIGEEAFWESINLYLNRFKFANVETSDLQKVFEETSGRDLDWFFKQWVYAEGYPTLKIARKYSPATKTLVLNVAQTHKADKDTPGAFILPLEVEIEAAGKSRIEKILVDKREQSFEFKLDAAPTATRFDKDSKIPLAVITATPRSISR